MQLTSTNQELMEKPPEKSSSPSSQYSLLLVAIGYTVFCIYGSWVPLKYQPISLAEARQRFLELPYLDIGPDHRADWVANLLLFIPLSFFWSAVFLADRHSKIRMFVCVVPLWIALAFFSGVIEFSQAWFPNRTMSRNDIYAESIGAAVGIALWLVVGQAVLEMVRKVIFDSAHHRRFDTTLELYFVGLILYQLLPLDLTLSLTELWHKYQSGKIELLPFSGWSLDPKFCYELLRGTVIFVPVGILISMGRCRAGEIRTFGIVFSVGLFVLFSVEILQLFVLSRHSSSTDIIIGLLGILLGYRLASLYGNRKALGKPSGLWGSQSSGFKLRLLFLVLSAAAPFGFFWFPFDFNMDRQQIQEAYESFWDLPFSKLYVGSEFNAISQVLAKAIFFMPLGIACGLLLEMPPFRFFKSASLLATLLLSAAVATMIEMGQLVLPSRYADITDILNYTGGSLVGYQLIWRGLIRN